MRVTLRGAPLLLALVALAAVTGAAPRSAQARRVKPAGAATKSAAGSQAARRASSLIAKGAAALESGDAAAAEQALSDAYRTSPSTEALYLLGKSAWAQGRKTAGRDFLRRYLADPATETDSPQGREALELLREPPEPSGEVRVIGVSNAKVLINDHIVGTLPLTLPLLLPVGTAKLTVEADGRRLEEQVKIVAGHSAELRFRPETGVIVVTMPPALAVLIDLPGVPAAELTVLTMAIEQSVRRAKLELFHWELLPGAQPESGACTRSLDCQRQLATRHELDYVATIRMQKLPSDPVPTLAVTLLDPAVAEPAATDQRACGPCAGSALQTSVEEAVTKVLSAGVGRPHGTLSVRSTPPGAEVRLGEQKLGVTPLSRVVWALPYELSLHQPGFLEHRQQLAVEENKESVVAVTLSPEPPEPSPAPLERYEERITRQRQPRPVWRLALGGVSLGIGSVVLGFGISGLYFDGRCTPDGAQLDVCASGYRYTSGAPGGSLVGLGTLLVVGGITALALPGPLHEERVRVRIPVAAASQ